jgi:nitroreductase
MSTADQADVSTGGADASQAVTSRRQGTFAEVVGSRRSIRWFHPDRAVERTAIQRILEAVRLTGSPGNLQPWRAVVVEAIGLPDPVRTRLLDANNRQGAHVLAPVWIYWYADPAAAAPTAFLAGLRELLPTGALPAAFGWSEDRARAAIQDGTAAPQGMPSLEQTVHELPPPISAILAVQETTAACTVAVLAAVAEGLGTCLQSVAAPGAQAEVKELLGMPERFVPVWLQLVGHPAESADAGGQRPRAPFKNLFALDRWGTAFPRDPAVVEQLRAEGLLQPAAPLPGRADELARLGLMFSLQLGGSQAAGTEPSG